MNLILIMVTALLFVALFKRPLLILLGAFIELFILGPNLDIASLLMSANIKLISIDHSKGVDKARALFLGILWYSLGRVTAFFIEVSFKILGFVKREIN